jgi:hypothetical protein
MSRNNPTEEELLRRQQCWIELSHAEDVVDDIYQVCTSWAEDPKGETPSERVKRIN